jgi:hypothetical protein
MEAAGGTGCESSPSLFHRIQRRHDPVYRRRRGARGIGAYAVVATVLFIARMGFFLFAKAGSC